MTEPQTGNPLLHPPPQLFNRPLLQPGHLHLAHPQDAGALLLGEALVKAEKNGLLLLVRQAVNGGAQGNAFQHLLLRHRAGQGGFQRQAVGVLLVQTVRRRGGQLGGGNLLRRQAGGL